MKVVKGIVYFVLIMLAAILLAAVFAPTSKIVTRSISIDAAHKTVFNQVANFENWKKWDAWYAKDTTQQRTYYGTLNDKKYGYSWSSENTDVGEGRMEMNEVTGTERLAYTFYFDGRPTSGSFTFNEAGDKTEVTWELKSELGYPFKLMNYFIDPLVGADFEEGLANLKKVAEAIPAEQLSDGSIQVANELGVNYALVKAVDLPMDQVPDFLEKAYEELYTYVSANSLTPKGPARGLYYEWNEENGTTTAAAAVPVSAVSTDSETAVELSCGAGALTQAYVACVYSGGASASYTVHNALSSWAVSNNKRILEPVVEEYIVGYRQTTDTTQHQTKIYYYYE